MPFDELKELMPLMEILSGPSFFSTSGQGYRLFGDNEKPFSVPTLSEISSVLAALKPSALSLEEALQQIESFAALTANENVREQPEPSRTVGTVECVCAPTSSPTLQLIQAFEESAVPKQETDIEIPLKFVKSESIAPNTIPLAKEVVREASQVLPTATFPPLLSPKEERRQPLRVIFDHVEEPLIVPFTKPESPPEEVKTKNAALKVVTECTPPICFSKVLKKCGQHRRKTQVLYRKQFALPPVSVLPVSMPPILLPPTPVVHETESLEICTSKPVVETPAFQWSALLDSLMQTASNQIRMLADHLAVQSNQGVKAICFKNVFPGDGCSTLLLCAARALTERNYRILLVDAHHRHIDLPKQLNLSGNLDSGSEVIELNDHLGLWVWQESKTAEANGAILAEVITANREKYDLILVDGGSVTESPLREFVEFWNRVALDGIILVSNTRHPAEIPLSHITGRLREHHIYLVGIMENYV